MSNIGFNEKTVHKLMDIIDSHKDKDIIEQKLGSYIR